MYGSAEGINAIIFLAKALSGGCSSDIVNIDKGQNGCTII